jgi:hypothetical protein
MNFLARLLFLLVLVCSFPGQGPARAQEQIQSEDQRLIIGKEYTSGLFACFSLAAAQVLIQADITNDEEDMAAAVVLVTPPEPQCGMIPKAQWRVKQLLGKYNRHDGREIAVVSIEVLTRSAAWQTLFMAYLGEVSVGDPA